MTPDRDSRAAIAVQRFGLGARPGELAAAAADPRGWLCAQLGAHPPPTVLLDGLAGGREALAAFLEARAARRAARPAPGAAGPDPVRERLRPLYEAHAAARTRLALTTATPFRERLVQFWSNHFAVSVDKPACLAAAGALEVEAIRPHVTGRFADLLHAVETHPAMIAYLDNAVSVGPHSPAARRASGRDGRGGRRGLNENLAREILELHTLGVDGGYAQADVSAFAAVLTGWSLGGGEGRRAAGRPGEFLFRPALHEPGAQSLLGRRYADDGSPQGEAVLRDLARHPATARHVAVKLARHFVADEPPAPLIEALRRRFLDSDGDLGAVATALVEHDAAWDPAAHKWKTPSDFIYSSWRALDLVPDEPRRLLAPFELLGQRHWSPGSPAGWPDRQADWDGAEALMRRIEWSVALADRVGHDREAVGLAGEVLGARASGATLEALRHAPSGGEAVALLLLSPEFQRR